MENSLEVGSPEFQANLNQFSAQTDALNAQQTSSEQSLGFKDTSGDFNAGAYNHLLPSGPGTPLNPNPSTPTSPSNTAGALAEGSSTVNAGTDTTTISGTPEKLGTEVAPSISSSPAPSVGGASSSLGSSSRPVTQTSAYGTPTFNKIRGMMG